MEINNKGQIAATLFGNFSFPVFWQSPTSTGQLLPGLFTRLNDQVMGINAAGVLVGSSRLDVGGDHAVVWQNLKIQDLNTLIPSGSGWVLTSATSINDQGVIVGTGTRTVNGVAQIAGFVLTPK